jgi:crotonobetainyl-CoA:carnitine CoA-transferase CaiB-like acyl-CoA transferase
MSGVLDGVTVLDLSTGVSGPMAAMLMADHGASVTKIERPGGDPGRSQPSFRVWNRGKRSAEVDLSTEAGRETLIALASRADVLIESFRPGVTTELGIDYETLAARNPRLIYCSITGYGRGTRDEQRPGWDALVAARAGLQWEKRGFAGGAINHIIGRPVEEYDVPDGAPEGPDREGPLFSASFWPSLSAAFLASVGINAALRAREHTGRGQRVETSLLQGVLGATLGGWQRVDKPDAPLYQTWIFDGRAPILGIFKCSDGNWVHNWVANPRFLLEASAGDVLQVPDTGATHRDDPDRIGTSPENLVVVYYYWPLLVDALAKFPSTDWVRVAGEFGSPLQPIRRPADALADPLWAADGLVAEIGDPEEGKLRMVGSTYRLTVSGGTPTRPAPLLGADTAEVIAEQAAPTPAPPQTTAASGKPPLAGIKVLDLGLAIAGPFGAQVLADLGADVIKINALHDVYWQLNHIALTSNRNKRSLALNLKTPEGMEVLRKLVEQADVVHHNMRYDAAIRLGVDYESLKQLNPNLIYCHTRGFEHGPRDLLPANDQTGAALSGISWEDGGGDAGGKPIWARTSFGDTGNGYLSAVGVIQALYHRDRTGEGQFVDTSIVYAGLLNTSYTYLRADGSEPERAKLDAEQFGLGAGYRLYETADGWLCLAAVADKHWAALTRALEPAHPFTKPDSPAADAALAATLADIFRTAPAEKWFEILDAAGVPVEISSDTYSQRVFDDAELRERGWTVGWDHPHVGMLEQTGLGVDLSDTPLVLHRPTPIVGQHSVELLREAGYAQTEIDALVAAGAVAAWSPGDPTTPPGV